MVFFLVLCDRCECSAVVTPKTLSTCDSRADLPTYPAQHAATHVSATPAHGADALVVVVVFVVVVPLFFYPISITIKLSAQCTLRVPKSRRFLFLPVFCRTDAASARDASAHASLSHCRAC